jgi:cobalt-zinc-cadmium resistance protein CzcA
MDTADVKVVTLYDQSYLIKQATDTVTTSLLIGALLVILILLFFTGSIRAALIPIFANIFCILTAFFLMKQYDVSANLLSLGGLALSLGMMVDATVMITENVFRHVVEEEHPEWTHERIVAEGVAEILKPTVLAVLVIVAVFGPVLVLKGIEGQLFIPLALAVVFSMIGSLIFAILITPGLCYWLIRGQRHVGPNMVMRALHRLYRAPLEFSVEHPWTVVAVCCIMMALSVITFRFTGSEFLPPLEEGNFRIRFTFPPSVSLPYMMDVTRRVEKKILEVLPEATQVTSYVGRPELGGDPESVSNDEVQVDLLPIEQWPKGVTKESMEEKLRQVLGGIPGASVQFSQQLEMRTDEMISGFNTPITVYVLGTDPDALKASALKVKQLLSQVPGAADVGVENFTGIDNLNIIPDRAAMARVGASVANVMDVVQTAIGGNAVGQVYQGNQRFDITVRVAPGSRSDANAIRNLRVTTASGMKVPLSSIATIKYDTGFDHIDRYNGMRRVVVMADVKDRSVGSVVDEAKKRIEAAGPLPGGCTLHWGGQAEEAEHAFEELTVAIPGALLIVFLLIYMCFDNLTDSFIVLSSIPLGIAGGTFLLMFMQLHLNVPAYIGFIAKFGIAVQNGMIMITYMNALRAEKDIGAREAAVEASMVRLRPELLSALIGSIGLVPFLVAAGTGATVERPLAAVVIGGVAVSRPMAWFLLPALYAWWKKRAPSRPPVTAETALE